MKIIQTLNSKNNSQVFIIEDNGCKYISKAFQNISRSMLIEISVLSSMNNNHIIKPISIKTDVTSEYPVQIIMNKADYTLTEYSMKNLTFDQKIVVLLEIAYGLRCLHSNDILHLDLKMDNVVMFNNRATLIDMGSSEYIIDSFVTTSEIKCTPTHRPPEAFECDSNGRIRIDKSFDIWSFGIIALELFSGEQLYLNKDILTIKSNTKYNDYDEIMRKYLISNEFQLYVSKHLPIILHSCLSFDSTKRPDIVSIICCLTNILDRSISLDIDNRIELEHVKNYPDIKPCIDLDEYSIYNTVNWFQNKLIYRAQCQTNIEIENAKLVCMKIAYPLLSIQLDISTTINLIQKSNGILFSY